jgi:hypothetical protein
MDPTQGLSGSREVVAFCKAADKPLPQGALKGIAA